MGSFPQHVSKTCRQGAWYGTSDSSASALAGAGGCIQKYLVSQPLRSDGDSAAAQGAHLGDEVRVRGEARQDVAPEGLKAHEVVHKPDLGITSTCRVPGPSVHKP